MCLCEMRASSSVCCLCVLSEIVCVRVCTGVCVATVCLCIYI